MARRILPHGTSTAIAQALLAVGEVVIDETNSQLRIGDGATLGGIDVGAYAASKFSAPSGTQSVGWTLGAANATNRSLYERIKDGALYITDFMTVAEVLNCRSGTGTVDVTQAVQRAFDQARISRKTVFAPDGVYLVGNLTFGENRADNVQSSSPMGLVGQSKIGTIFRAKPGLNGTLLKSLNLAGVEFASFTIETSGSNAQAWDCRWVGGPGPSTQNVIRHIIITGTPTIPDGVPQWDIDNLNDTYPLGVTVRLGDEAKKTIAISCVQTGGLTLLSGCIWTGGYLRFGCQNGKLDGCWGHGIEFAGSSVNCVEISAGYMYPNPTHDAVFWSQSYSSFQSVHSLTCTATQMISDTANVSSYLNLNAYSMLKFVGCEFIGPCTKMLGPNSRADGFMEVVVKFEGGMKPGALELNSKGGFRYVTEGFIDNQTAKAVQMVYQGGWDVVGATSAGTKNLTTNECEFTREGDRVYVDGRVAWNSHTGTGQLRIIAALPPSVKNVAVTVGYAGNIAGPVTATYGGGYITLYGSGGGPLDVIAAGDLILAFNYRYNP